jgi:hypothetical protein
MGIYKISSVISKNLANLPGWSTQKKIVVFESDDWGSIRTSSIESVNRLIDKGIDFKTLDAERYSFNDSLANTDDLVALFDTLNSVRDSQGQPAIFTALSLVANPDMDAIRGSGFTRYIYEPLNKTLKMKFTGINPLELWIQGIRSGIFIPQFHGREHLNVTAWMNALRKGHPETLAVFNEGMWGYVNSFYDGRKINYQEAFNIHDPSEINLLEDIIKDGLNLFNKLFGFRASFFVAPNGPFPNILEKSLCDNGIAFIGKQKIQEEPLGYGRTRKVLHYLGMKNRFGQIYMTRNCYFEPGSPDKNDWIDSCLREINIAFRWHKPAIISTHRVNYVGQLNIKNRDNGLRNLRSLLMRIINNWPDVVFMSSDKLGDLIMNGRSRFV